MGILFISACGKQIINVRAYVVESWPPHWGWAQSIIGIEMEREIRSDRSSFCRVIRLLCSKSTTGQAAHPSTNFT